jgi:hypothetical protein
MKLQHDLVLKILDQMMAFADGMVEAVRMGDDGFQESVSGQRDSMKKLIKAFVEEHLTIKEVENTIKCKYLAIADSLNENQQLRPHEIVASIQAEAYRYVKKQLKLNPVTDEMNNHDVMCHVSIILYEWPKFKRYEAEMNRSLMQVETDIVDEYIESRAKTPQQSIFK